MGKKVVNIGDVFGFLTIEKEIEPVLSGGQYRRRFLCECKCGKKTEKHLMSLTRKKYTSVSCGCARKNNTHNCFYNNQFMDEYNSWRGMKKRCYNQKNASFKHYGGRGIKVCERWFNSFENFLADVGPKPSKDFSIDRIDVNGNYEPCNVRWADAKTQAKNRRK